MKLNLLLADLTNAKTGWINISPFSHETNPEVVRGELHNLGVFIDQGELSEILALDILDFVPVSQRKELLAHWISFLEHGGKLILSGVDMYEISKLAFLRAFNLEQLNNVFYGQNVIRQGLFDIQYIVNILGELGLEILSAKLENLYYIIEARRK